MIICNLIGHNYRQHIEGKPVLCGDIQAVALICSRCAKVTLRAWHIEDEDSHIKMTRYTSEQTKFTNSEISDME